MQGETPQEVLVAQSVAAASPSGIDLM